MNAARIGEARARAGRGDAAGAEALLREAIAVDPSDPLPLQLLADLLLRQQQTARALPAYRQLLAMPRQRSALNLLHLGFCEEAAGRLEEAAARYREALAIEPHMLEAHVNLAGLLWRLSDFDGAVAHGREAVAIAPAHPFAQRILGAALLNRNALDEAERHLRRALELQPAFPAAQFDLAMTVLLGGRLAEGWPLYAQRWTDPRARRPAFFQAAREWPGPSVPLAGQSIAVYGEQGHGDMLQMLRFLPRLQALGAQVHCVLPAELVPLVEASFPGVHCLRAGEALQVQWHAALLDLPGRLPIDLADLPGPMPYLRAPAEAAARWRERMAAWEGGVRIGLAWSGSPAQVNNRNRALPLSLLLPITELPGVQCFSLQKDDAGAWTDAQPAPGRLVDLTDGWSSFAESAAMLERLDLVITIDSAVAHLAGALGKPVWLLLPPNADWRWLLDRADSPWYPSARLFRRGLAEPRATQVRRVREALPAWLAGRAA